MYLFKNDKLKHLLSCYATTADCLELRRTLPPVVGDQTCYILAMYHEIPPQTQRLSALVQALVPPPSPCHNVFLTLLSL